MYNSWDLVINVHAAVNVRKRIECMCVATVLADYNIRLKCRNDFANRNIKAFKPGVVLGIRLKRNIVASAKTPIDSFFIDIASTRE